MNDNAFRRLVMAQMNKLMEASGSGDAFDLPSMINAIVDARGAAEPRPMSEAPRDGTDILGQMRNGERRICCWSMPVSMWAPSEPLGWWPRAEMAKQAKAACAGLPTSGGGDKS